ncbi:hypothetical protein [Actinacidiphila rubida]|uniref:Uncharacterized protein n=1 Tax=Actinacidiphila rubida TaxID=310780 RepID=A0A1H8P0I2_9ACTN|nr:hypothetical protein [Actinacidiphila rubida]SEO35123.1 hypothetical protein SAMN05216267_102419 [Actinacidiphila rubida]
MSAVVAAMVAAVAGVLGTLLAPLISHRVTVRQRTFDHDADERLRRHQEKRAAYIALNRASRQLHTLLKDALHRLRDGVFTDQERTQVEEARLDYRDRYAEAQLTVPETVLAASREVNAILAGVDAVVKRIDRGGAGPSETPDQALLDLKAAEPRLSAMSHLMRRDLGVAD